MKPILSSKELTIPEGVEVTCKSRRFVVTGPRGKLSKDLSHIAADMYLIDDAEAGTKKLRVEIHFSTRKGLSSLRTVISHVSNMITGVTLGYKYKMRLVYAHFPINANAEKGGDALSIRNFLGEKIVRTIPMCDGVKCVKDLDVKDQILFEGNSIENVSRSCALVHQSCLVKHKDIRKFLDGIYVQEKGTIVEEDSG